VLASLITLQRLCELCSVGQAIRVCGSVSVDCRSTAVDEDCLSSGQSETFHRTVVSYRTYKYIGAITRKSTSTPLSSRDRGACDSAHIFNLPPVFNPVWPCARPVLLLVTVLLRLSSSGPLVQLCPSSSAHHSARGFNDATAAPLPRHPHPKPIET
jgi:hypothetical protein